MDRDLGRWMAEGIPDARLLTYPGQRHGVRGTEFEQDLVSSLVDRSSP